VARVPARWDDDDRGRGVADARRLLPGVEELMTALADPDWVAEHPEAHPFPHLRRRFEADGSPFELAGAGDELDGGYAVDLAWRGARGDLRAVRASVYALVGEVAESATYVRERVVPPAADVDGGAPGARVVFEILTGMLDADTPFASHGHVLLLRVAGAFPG
jgi:hypothetical protein